MVVFSREEVAISGSTSQKQKSKRLLFLNAFACCNFGSKLSIREDEEKCLKSDKTSLLFSV